MSSGLPVQIQVQKAVARAVCLNGRMKLSSMKRLLSSLVDTEGFAEVSVEFGRREDGSPRLTGTIQADLKLECQRCLGEMILPLNSSIDLLLRETATDEDDDVIVVSEGVLRLHELIEDELILALPVIAIHEDRQDCVHSPWLQEEPEADETGRESPFAILAELKPDSTSTR